MTWAIFDESHAQGIVEILEGTDRVTAIVGGALLEDAVSRTLSERLRKDGDINNKLTKPSGALGNIVPKIDLLYLLYAFDKTTRTTMYGIAEVRNLFAHNLNASFDSKKPKMIDAMKKLSMHENLTHYPHHLYAKRKSKHEIGQVKTGRDRFLVNLQLCLVMLMRDRVSHKTWSNTALSEKALRKEMKAAAAGP